MYMANWCSGCEAGSGVVIREDETKEFILLKICYYSNHRYSNQKLLSIVSWISESGHLLLARSKINHTLSGMGPLGSKYVGLTKNHWAKSLIRSMDEGKWRHWNSEIGTRDPQYAFKLINLKHYILNMKLL